MISDLQIFSHGLDSLKDIRRDPVEEIPFEIGEDMSGGTRSDHFTAFLMKNSIMKDQFSHLCSLHGRLDDQGVSKGGWKLELTGQLHHRSQEIHILELKGAHLKPFGQFIATDLKPADIVAMPNHAISIHFVESNL
jgi:hypothetical protein